VSNHKIFVSIASYRDPLLQFTVNNFYKKSSCPENLVFGIAWQKDFEQESWMDFKVPKDQLRIIEIPYQDSGGCCRSRSRIYNELLRDEDFVLQIDSHMSAVDSWDIMVTKDYNLVPEKSLLTHNPAWLMRQLDNGDPFRFEFDFPQYDVLEYLDDSNRVIMGCPHPHLFEPSGFLMQRSTHRRPSLLPKLNALSAGAFLFGPSAFFKTVKYDPRMYFLGEEQSLAVRAFTHGWITFSTTQNYSYHRADREYRYGLHWEGKEVEEKIQYSYRILRSVLENSKEEDVDEYGLGEELSLSDFQKYSGIDFKNRTIETNHPKPIAPEVLGERYRRYDW